MHRRKLTVAAAIFAIGAAFAAEPTSIRADWGDDVIRQSQPWSPGTGSVMSAYDPNQSLLMPPR